MPNTVELASSSNTVAISTKPATPFYRSMVAMDLVPINEPIQHEMPPEYAVVEDEDVAMDEDIRSEATTTYSNKQTESSLSATEWKEQGNTLFQQNKFAESLEAYTHALKSLEQGEPSTTPRTNEVALVVSLFSNRALVLFKMRQFQLAEQECSKALEMDPDKVKVLFRRTCSREGQHFDNKENKNNRKKMTKDILIPAIDDLR
jgi:tetratricopeptide (TPR) repeat protein